MIVLRSLLFASECFFGASFILGIAWLAARGRPAAMRHLIWSGAFAAMLVLPIVALIVPSQMVWQVAHDAPTPMPIVVAGPASAMVPEAAHGFDFLEVIFGIYLVWMAGILTVLLRAAVGGVGLMYLKARSVPYIPEGIDGSRFRGARWQLRLRTSPGESGPVTWGVLKPVVLLPKAAVLWPRERLEAVLLHEFAHVRRRDALARLIALTACAFYWPNPFAWTAARLMRRDAEIAADDAVLTTGMRPSSYAEQLVGLAREFSGDRPSLAGVALSMAERSTLHERVQSVLSPVALRKGVTKMDILKIAAFGVALTSALALSRPSFAETAPDAVPEATPAVTAEPTPTPVPAKKNCRCQRHTAQAAPEVPLAAPEIVIAPEAPEPSVTPPAPPAPPAPPEAYRYDHHRLSDAEKEQIRRDARKAAAEARRAASDAQKAIADAHIDEVVADALQKAQAAIKDAHVSETVRKAIAEAHIEEKVARAMERAQIEIRKAQPHIQKAIIHSRRHGAHRNGDDVDTDVDVDVDTDTSSDK